MRLIRKVVKRAFGAPREFHDKRYIRHMADGDHNVKDVPYQAQFASPELISDILNKKVLAKDDPKWEVFGFDSNEEAGYWAERMCGVACMKMLIDKVGKDVSMADLVRECVEKCGYDIATDRGWFHEPMREVLEQNGISSKIVPHATVATLARHLTDGRLFIASVNPEIIRFDDVVTSRQKGGHLVLVLGVRTNDGKISGFFLHNPSGRTKETREKAYVPRGVFEQAFGKRGILVTRTENG